jgi:hypothetical protein
MLSPNLERPVQTGLSVFSTIKTSLCYSAQHSVHSPFTPLSIRPFTFTPLSGRVIDFINTFQCAMALPHK